MYGYRLELPAALSETVWACQTRVCDYEWKNRNTKDMIEINISCCDARMHRVRDFDTHILRGTVLSCLVGDTPVVSEAQTGVEVQILSVAVRFPMLSVTEKELDEQDLADSSVLLLPLSCEELSQTELAEIERLLHQYIQSSMLKSACAKAACNAIFLELLCLLDALVRRAPQKAKYANFYVGKADAILKRRYAEKLTLGTVAAELGITPSYLSAVFKRHTGQGFSERLLTLRMEKVRALLEEGGYTACELAAQAGLGDERNLRRRFKQYFGTGLGEYRHIAREQTLYHERPIRKM